MSGRNSKSVIKTKQQRKRNEKEDVEDLKRKDKESSPPKKRFSARVDYMPYAQGVVYIPKDDDEYDERIRGYEFVVDVYAEIGSGDTKGYWVRGEGCALTIPAEYFVSHQNTVLSVKHVKPNRDLIPTHTWTIQDGLLDSNGKDVGNKDTPAQILLTIGSQHLVSLVEYDENDWWSAYVSCECDSKSLIKK